MLYVCAGVLGLEPLQNRTGEKGGAREGWQKARQEWYTTTKAKSYHTGCEGHRVVMASTDDGVDVRIEPPSSAGDSDHEREEKEAYKSTVERLRSLVFCTDQNANMDEIRRLVCLPLPASSCGVDDAISPIRANLWSAMLLGLRPEDLIRSEFSLRFRGIMHRHFVWRFSCSLVYVVVEERNPRRPSEQFF